MYRRMVLTLCLAFTCFIDRGLQAADLPDTQTPEFATILTRYQADLTIAQEKHKTAMTKHLTRYLEEAGEMLKEKRKARNTTGIAIATTASSIFESALSNLTTTGTFEVPAKVRRELETTLSEFNTGRALIDSTLANETTKLFKQYSDEFAAQVIKITPALTGPESRALIDTRFKAMGAHVAVPTPKPQTTVNTNGPVTSATGTNTADAALNPVMAESGSSPSWTPVGTLTAYIRALEVLELNLAAMQMGTNLMKQYNAISDSTTEILFITVKTNFTSPTCLYRLVRIPKFNDVNVMDWPTPATGYRLNVRTPFPERIPYAVGFELQVSELPQPGNPAGRAAPVAPRVRTIDLSVRSTPSRASVYIDGALHKEVTPCVIQLPVGTHDFKLSLSGYQDFVATNYNFTANRELTWVFKPKKNRP